jgi:hypothetical protein
VRGQRPPIHGHARKGAATRTYRIWQNMKTRCLNPLASNYAYYGQRGIGVCERWMTFANFVADMGEAPAGKSIDRIDTSRGYEPANCRWLDHKGQTRNTRGNRLVTYQGETRCISEWAERLGLNVKLLYQHITRDGWPVDRAMTYTGQIK